VAFYTVTSCAPFTESAVSTAQARGGGLAPTVTGGKALRGADNAIVGRAGGYLTWGTCGVEVRNRHETPAVVAFVSGRPAGGAAPLFGYGRGTVLGVFAPGVRWLSTTYQAALRRQYLLRSALTHTRALIGHSLAHSLAHSPTHPLAHSHTRLLARPLARSGRPTASSRLPACAWTRSTCLSPGGPPELLRAERRAPPGARGPKWRVGHRPRPPWRRHRSAKGASTRTCSRGSTDHAGRGGVEVRR
jgi:hypothetical protein